MKVGSLFSGAGMGDFGFLAAGMEIRWQCEIDEHCQKRLQLRYPESVKYTDIKKLKGNELEAVDIITGGFPCQPFSVAGKQRGQEDDRYLWPEMLRVIAECRPCWVVGENVPGIINLALETVCADLEAKGYEVWPVVFPSHALGAWQKRERLWIMAHSHNARRKEQCWAKSVEAKYETTECGGKNVADTISNAAGTTQRQETNIDWPSIESQHGCRLGDDVRDGSQTFRRFWESEPAVGRVVNGCPDRVHRLKMLGNGQVPACTYVIGRMIMEIESRKT